MNTSFSTSFSTGFHSKQVLPPTARCLQPARKCFNRNARPFFKPGILCQQKREGEKLIHHLNHQKLINRASKELARNNSDISESRNSVRPEPVEGRVLRPRLSCQSSFDSAQDERRPSLKCRNYLRTIPNILPNPRQHHHSSTHNRRSTPIITSLLDKMARLASGSGTLAVKLLIVSTLVASSTARHINNTTPEISAISLFKSDTLNTRPGANQTTSLQSSNSSESHIFQHILWGCMIFAFVGIMAWLVGKMATIRNETHIEQPRKIRTKLTARI